MRFEYRFEEIDHAVHLAKRLRFGEEELMEGRDLSMLHNTTLSVKKYVYFNVDLFEY